MWVKTEVSLQLSFIPASCSNTAYCWTNLVSRPCRHRRSHHPPAVSQLHHSTCKCALNITPDTHTSLHSRRFSGSPLCASALQSTLATHCLLVGTVPRLARGQTCFYNTGLVKLSLSLSSREIPSLSFHHSARGPRLLHLYSAPQLRSALWTDALQPQRNNSSATAPKEQIKQSYIWMFGYYAITLKAKSALLRTVPHQSSISDVRCVAQEYEQLFAFILLALLFQESTKKAWNQGLPQQHNCTWRQMADQQLPTNLDSQVQTSASCNHSIYTELCQSTKIHQLLKLIQADFTISSWCSDVYAGWAGS